MSIPNSRLPQRAIISSSGTSIDDYGDVTGGTILHNDIPCRVTLNRSSRNDSMSEAGYISKSTHLIFMNKSYGGVDLTLKIGYTITVSSEIYVIEFIDSAPGGVEGHHNQIYCTKRK